MVIVKNEMIEGKQYRIAVEKFNSSIECYKTIEKRAKSNFVPIEDVEKKVSYTRRFIGMRRSDLADCFSCGSEKIDDWHGKEKGIYNWKDIADACEGKKCKNIEVFKNAINIKSYRMPKSKTVLYVEGHTPCVPFAIQGFPFDMYSTKIKRSSQKTINIVIDQGVHCGIKAEEILKANEKITSAIIRLEAKEGIRCGITTYVSAVYKFDGEMCIMSTVLKRPQDHLDIKRLVFPLSSAAYFRVVGFNWWNVTPECYIDPCYGYPVSSTFGQDGKDQIAVIATGDPNSVNISTYDFLNMSEDEIVEYVKEKAIRTLQKRNSRKSVHA